MKIYNKDISFKSPCYPKIKKALADYAPDGVSFVDNIDEADIAILHVNGRYRQFKTFADDMLKKGKKYVVAQYCLKSTRRKLARYWGGLWRNSHMVWSYYDLPRTLKSEGASWTISNFYHSPLGADENTFTLSGDEQRSRIVFACGTREHSLDNESLSEIAEAADKSNRYMYHLGPDLNLGWRVLSETGISDQELASRYRRCAFVSGLRKVEGFEVPVVEGLFCGCRPIVFDKPHYRMWYGPWAEFIPETSREEIVNNLTKLFSYGAKVVTQEERRAAVEKFSWKNIITGFWKKAL